MLTPKPSCDHEVMHQLAIPGANGEPGDELALAVRGQGIAKQRLSSVESAS